MLICVMLTSLNPIIKYKIIQTIINVRWRLKANFKETNFLYTLNFLNRYYRVNDLVWQEGFFIDFVQKKSVDKFIRRFLILSTYLYSERLVFDKLIRVYSDTILFLTNYKTIFEFNSVANILSYLLATLSIFIVLATLLPLLQWRI